MKIMVSACLLGKNCKYNGKNNYCKKVIDYTIGHEVIPVCPEVSGGLSTPRAPGEIVNGVVKTKEGISVDYEYRKGAEIEVKKAVDEKVDLVILQSRSPSCGVNEIYDGSFTGTKIKGQGVFAKALVAAGIKVMDVEDIMKEEVKHEF